MERLFRKVRYAIRLFKIVGPTGFFHELKRQVYCRSTHVGLERDLDTNSVRVVCSLKYSLRPASEEDMGEVLQKSKSESKQSAHELLQRKWFYESGFHNCYVARTADTGELCFIVWLVCSEDDHMLRRGFRSRLPRLKEGECLLENAFTFERYRGNGIGSSVYARLCEMARRNGFKRAIAYGRQDNIPAVKSLERAGFRRFAEIPELKLLFFTKRKHS